MIERYFMQAKVICRLRSGPIGPYLPELVSALEQRRYSKDTIRRHLRCADALGRWLEGQNVALIEANQSHIGQYLSRQARIPTVGYLQGRLCKAATSIPVIAKLLREQGVFSGSAAVSITDAWLGRFDDHLIHVHGMSRFSRDNYVRYARRLIQSFQTNEFDWRTLDAGHISEFVRCEAAKLKPESCRQPVTAVRAILRFLVAEGLVPANLHRAIPVIRVWRHTSLPQHLSTEQLGRVLEICRSPAEWRLRDTCIVLMMARLGMRAGEVRQLRLDDIDWIAGVIHVRRGKSRCERTLPLLEDVGRVLGTYLQQERPITAERSIFLTSLPPHRPLASSTTITKITKRILKQAQIKGSRLGAHRLRHTVATHMVRGGSSFKEIADVLGHKALGSTGIYARLDERGLEQIALPWPGDMR
jgi:site-specific recombinase XerD